MTQKIGVLVGSLRRESLNRKIAQTLAAFAPSSLAFEMIEIGTLPLYNQDLEDSPPAEWVKFRDLVKSCDGLLFVTPEYNRSIPAVLKNAVDVGSRPYGHNVWDGKPAAVVSVSPGAMGGFGSNNHLRQSLTCLNVLCMATPEAYIGSADKLFDEHGKITNESTVKFLQKFVDAFVKWVEKVA